MKKILPICFIAATSILASGAMAGAKYGYPAVVSATSIAGSFGATRASGGTTDYMDIVDTGTSIYVSGRGIANGVSASCVTTNPTLMAQLRSAKSDTFLNVGISAGQCTYLYVTNSSGLAVKVQ